MKKISSVILAVLLAFSSIFCVNIAFADENAPTLTKELKLNGAWSEEYDSKITDGATWFKFHIDYQGKFKLQMKTYDALDVKLYNSEFSKTYFTTVIKEFNDTKTKTKSESVVLNPGDYYLRVEANGKYALNASFGLNSYVNPEAVEIGKVYSGLSTDDDGSYWYKIDLKNKGKYTLSLTSSGIATAEVYNSDMSKSLDVIYVFSGSDLAKTSTKDIDLDKETFSRDGIHYKSPYEGMYSMYNCAVVLNVAKNYGISQDCVKSVFSHAPQPAGRNETFTSKEQTCILNLVKNPTGANEVMKVIEKDDSDKTIVIVLNDREQDGTDVSWIYDTFFEKIMKDSTKEIICTGLRANDMALRIYYGGYKGPLSVVDTLDIAVKAALATKRTTYAIATYTALLPTRNAIKKEMGI